jgi:hypothetical protein
VWLPVALVLNPTNVATPLPVPLMSAEVRLYVPPTAFPAHPMAHAVPVRVVPVLVLQAVVYRVLIRLVGMFMRALSYKRWCLNERAIYGTGAQAAK